MTPKPDYMYRVAHLAKTVKKDALQIIILLLHCYFHLPLTLVYLCKPKLLRNLPHNFYLRIRKAACRLCKAKATSIVYSLSESIQKLSAKSICTFLMFSNLRLFQPLFSQDICLFQCTT